MSVEEGAKAFAMAQAELDGLGRRPDASEFRRVGVWLRAARRNCPHGWWENSCAELGVSQQTAANWMKLAELDEQECAGRTMTEALALARI